MRILSYYDILDLFDREILNFDIDESAFDSSSSDFAEVVQLDHNIKNRALHGVLTDNSNQNVNELRKIKIHTTNKQTLNLAFMNMVKEVSVLERLTSTDINIFSYVTISEDAVKMGFKLIQPNYSNLAISRMDSVLVVNTQKLVTSIPKDFHMLDMFILL